jgi:transcriptional regulator with XRE-family HTH domain
MTLQDRIKEAIDGSGLSPAEFSRAAKVSQSAINQLAEGKTKSLKADTAAHIEMATGYKATWLALGKGQKKVDAAHPGTDQPSDLAVIAPMPLRQTLERLAYFLGESPPDKREIIGSMLDRLAKHPHDKATIDLMLPWMTRAPD